MDVEHRALQLRADRVPHAVATVVRARRPSSAKPGDRALITADEAMLGWVGGACADSIIQREGLTALATGQPRYVVLDSEGTATLADDDRILHPLSCHSGGAMEVFIEPFAPPLLVTIVGATPVATTLAALCSAAGYDSVVTADAADVASDSFVVVATMGHADELTAERALQAGAPYVAVVASRRRAEVLRRWLTDRGVDTTALHSPAGLDLGARTQEGIAVSILAEIVQEQQHTNVAAPATPLSAPASQPEAVDPVCGMTVATAAKPYHTNYDGRRWQFCCAHCLDAFVADPARYAGTPL